MLYVKEAQWNGRKFMMNLDEFQSQYIVTDTKMKAEYMTALVAAKEGICVKKFVYQTRCSSKQASNM